MKDKLKQLTKDTAVYGISTILSRFLSFILVPFYSHALGQADNGVVGALYSYIAFLNIIYLYGMDSAYMKYATKYEDRKDDVFSSPFISVIATSAFISLLMILFRGTVNSALDITDGYSHLLWYFVLILFFDALSAIPFAWLRIARKAKRFALLKSVNIMVNVGLNLVLLLIFRMGVEAVFIANLAASVLTLILLLPDIAENFRWRVDTTLFKEMLRFGLPYLPASLASMVIQVIDRPILMQLTDSATAGVYQINYKLGVFMMLFVSMFQYAWQPFFLHNAKEKDAPEIFSRVLSYFVIAGSIVLVFLSLFIENIVQISIMGRTFIDSRYWVGLPIVPVVLAGYLFNGIYVNLTAGIFIKEKTKYIPYVTAAGALVNVVVNFSLIPVWGIMGAALATFASYVVMATGLYMVTRRIYKIEYEYSRLIKTFLSVALTSVALYTFELHSAYLKVLLFAAFILMLLLLNVIRKNEMASIAGLVIRKKGKQS